MKLLDLMKLEMDGLFVQLFSSILCNLNCHATAAISNLNGYTA